MSKKCIFISLLSAILLTSCFSYDFSRRVVQQGNLLAPAKIHRLTLGMRKEDVAILMGTSLLSPLFNDQRWDYVYEWRKGQGPTIHRHLIIYFTNERVSRIDHVP